MIDELSKEPLRIDTAKQILVSGASHGGYAAFMHVDWLKQKLPSVDVRGNPQAGWFGKRKKRSGCATFRSGTRSFAKTGSGQTEGDQLTKTGPFCFCVRFSQAPRSRIGRAISGTRPYAKTVVLNQFIYKRDLFTKTGSGQT